MITLYFRALRGSGDNCTLILFRCVVHKAEWLSPVSGWALLPWSSKAFKHAINFKHVRAPSKVKGVGMYLMSLPECSLGLAEVQAQPVQIQSNSTKIQDLLNIYLSANEKPPS